MEDRDIVELYWRRDERALAETASRLDDYCLSIARSVLGDGEDARECVNDAYLAAWNAIPPHRPDSLPAFLVTLARRAAISRLRAENRAKDVPREHLLALEELEEILHPVFQRFFSGRPLKSLNKMADISKTAGIRYIEYGRIGRPEQFHGVPDADVIDIIHAGPAEGLLKKAAEILLVEIHERCQILEVDLVAVVLIDIGKH